MDNARDNARLQDVRRLLKGQTAPISSDGNGRAYLAQCPHCGERFLRNGRIVMALTPDEAHMLAGMFGASLENLPEMLCEACHRAHHGGLCEVDEYRLPVEFQQVVRYGFGLSWESPGIHALALMWPVEFLPHMAHIQPDVVTQPALLQQSLAWLARADLPAQAQEVPAALLRLLAGDTPPGHGEPGTAGWVWRGVQWRAGDHPLGPTYVLLIQAMPPLEPYSPTLTLALWRVVATGASRVD